MSSKYQPSKLAQPVHSCEFGNRVVFQDNAVATGDLVAADILNLVKIPAGTLVDRVVIKNPDLDSSTALTVKIGFAPADGTTGASGDDVIVIADGALWRAAATTTYEIFPPFRANVDSFLAAVVGTGATGSSGGGTVYGKVEGEALGAK